jgi:hypothetical protein
MKRMIEHGDVLFILQNEKDSRVGGLWIGTPLNVMIVNPKFGRLEIPKLPGGAGQDEDDGADEETVGLRP